MSAFWSITLKARFLYENVTKKNMTSVGAMNEMLKHISFEI